MIAGPCVSAKEKRKDPGARRAGGGDLAVAVAGDRQELLDSCSRILPLQAPTWVSSDSDGLYLPQEGPPWSCVCGGGDKADSTVRGLGMGGHCCVLLRMASAPRHRI
jgi:hypothetical protein